MDFKELSAKINIYHRMIFTLVLLLLVAALYPRYGFGAKALIPVLISVITAAALDMPLKYFKHKEWEFPHCAIVSGLFIGGILTQDLPWHVYAAASAIAILQKYIIRFNGKHIFNPAAFGIFISTLIFPKTFDSWWIASPLILVIIFGIVIIWRMKRIDLALSFLAVYFTLSRIMGLLSPKMHMGMMHGFYLEFINMGIIFFFACFMLIEPKTHPTGKKQRIVYGILLAIILAVSEMIMAPVGLLLLLLIGNMLVPFFNRINFEFRKPKGQ